MPLPGKYRGFLLDVANEEIASTDRLVITLTVRDKRDRTISVASLTFANEWTGHSR